MIGLCGRHEDTSHCLAGHLTYGSGLSTLRCRAAGEVVAVCVCACIHACVVCVCSTSTAWLVGSQQLLEPFQKKGQDGPHAPLSL